jgi:hypothetical protein
MRSASKSSWRTITIKGISLMRNLKLTFSIQRSRGDAATLDKGTPLSLLNMSTISTLC